MKTKCIFLILILIVQLANSQEIKTHFFNEYSISLNNAYSNDAEMPSKAGFGIGIFHSHDFYSFLAISGGLEYNNTHFYSKYDQWSHFYEEKDVKYSVHYMSIPLNIRLSVGKKFRIFAEGGAFFENYLLAISEGVSSSYNPDTRKETKKNYKRVKLTCPIDYGYQVNIGMQISSGQHAILIKSGLTYGKLAIVEMDIKKFYNRYAKISIVLKL